MSNLKCTEIAEFTIIPSVNEDEFVEIVSQLEESFHSKQKGFIDTELLKANNNSDWIMIQHWESVEDAKNSSRLMMQVPVTEAFRCSLDPKSVKLRYLNQIKTWFIT